MHITPSDYDFKYLGLSQDKIDLMREWTAAERIVVYEYLLEELMQDTSGMRNL